MSQVRKLITLDPRKRLSAREALRHPWVKGQATNFVHLSQTVEKMKSFNARRKFKVIFFPKNLSFILFQMDSVTCLVTEPATTISSEMLFNELFVYNCFVKQVEIYM